MLVKEVGDNSRGEVPDIVAASTYVISMMFKAQKEVPIFDHFGLTKVKADASSLMTSRDHIFKSPHPASRPKPSDILGFIATQRKRLGE